MARVGFIGILAAAALALGPPAGAATGFIPSEVSCSIGSGGQNTLLRCPGDINAMGEPSVAVDPANPRHVVVMNMEPATCCMQIATTFNGGSTWRLRNFPAPDPPSGDKAAMADAMLAFDARHRTLVAIGLTLAIDPTNFETGDDRLVATVSRNGGRTWSAPAIIASGSGFGPHQLFNDKPWLSVDNHRGSPHFGRLYATWDLLRESGTSFGKDTEYGVTRFAFSDDGGATWTTPRSIRPRSPLCPSRAAGGTPGVCDRNFFTTSTVTPDGTVHLAFGNPENSRTLADQYLEIRSRNGGRTWSAPTHIVDMEDGINDYPLGKSDQETLSGMQLSVSAFGNITSDFRTGRLALVFSDNREGSRAATRTRIFAMRSADGVRWHGPVQVSGRARDDWMPFADFNPVTHRLGILYQHRIGRRPTYVAMLATKRRGRRGFSRTPVSNRISQPNTALWYLFAPGFPFGPGKPPCATCAQWAGDYVGLQYGSDGTANAAWNDMRRFLRVRPSKKGPAVPSGHLQAVGFARVR